jgi:hypothetical protein
MPAVHRVTDTVLSPNGTGKDCERPMEIAQDKGNGSNVFAENLLIVNQGIVVAPHNKPGCNTTDQDPLSTHSSTVFIGNRGIARIGDQYGDNIATKGSSTVFSS